MRTSDWGFCNKNEIVSSRLIRFKRLTSYSLCRHHRKEVPQGGCVPQGDTVPRVPKPLNHALWGITVALKETRNLMTVLHVTLGMYKKKDAQSTPSTPYSYSYPITLYNPVLLYYPGYVLVEECPKSWKKSLFWSLAIHEIIRTWKKLSWNWWQSPRILL